MEQRTKDSFRSTFAKEMEEELARNAARIEDKDERATRAGENNNKETEDLWRLNRKKEKEKDEARRIDWQVLEPKIKVNNSDSSSSEDESWNEIDRRGKNEEKRKKTAEKRSRLKEETATKASRMLGIGPVTRETKKHFENITER